MTLYKDMEGQVALITGAGNGIGREAARQLAARGAVVAVNDLKPEFVAATIAMIEAEGGRAIDATANVSTREGLYEAVGKAVEGGGRLDVLVNNAAWVRYQSVPEIRLDTLDRMLDVGFKGVIWGIQAAVEVMDRERGGRIVNVASTAALRSTLNSVVYSGIKSGITGITRAAAAELGALNIRVNAVCPSAVPTEGTERNRNAERDARRVASTPLGRLGNVSDIAGGICYLASPQSSFITGQALVIDGGVTFSNIA